MAETRQERRNNFHRNRQERTNPESDKPYGHVEALPMTAGPKDLKVGEDELGNPVYQTLSGNRYVIKLKEDQRTPMRQFKEDTVPAVRDYLQNPTMPTREQIVDFGKDVVEEAYNMVERSVSGEGSLGDVYGSATMVGGLSVGTHVPENSLRIFGGKTRIPKDKLKEYEELKAANIPEREAWQQTGLFWDNYNKQVRREFDLSKATFKNLPENVSLKDLTEDSLNVLQNYKSGGIKSKYSFKLKDVLDFEDLYKEYPELQDIDVIITGDMPGVYGVFQPGTSKSKPSIKLNRAYPKMFKRVILHELQHAVQDIEKINSGSSTDAIRSLLRKSNPTFMKNYDKELRAISLLEDLKKKGFLKKGEDRLLEDLKSDLEYNNQIIRSYYYNNRGELEARAVEKRWEALVASNNPPRESVIEGNGWGNIDTTPGEVLQKRKEDLTKHPEALIRSEKHPSSKLYSDDDLKRPKDDLYDHMASSSEVPNLKEVRER